MLLKNKEMTIFEANLASVSQSISYRLAKKTKLKTAAGEERLALDDFC
jgi:hypothetical protein